MNPVVENASVWAIGSSQKEFNPAFLKAFNLHFFSENCDGGYFCKTAENACILDKINMNFFRTFAA